MILLIQTICTLSTPDEFIKTDQENIELATADLKKSTIVARAKDNKGRLHHRNIIHMLDQLSIPEMQHHIIGVGGARTRTHTQQKLANNYTKVTVHQAHDSIIFVDGSINTKDNPNYNNYSNSGCGGCGGSLLSKETNTQTPLTFFKENVNTNDPQRAELQGMLRALQLAEQTYAETDRREFSTLCNCKGAVSCMNHQHSVSYQYSNTCQKMQKQITQLESKRMQHEIT